MKRSIRIFLPGTKLSRVPEYSILIVLVMTIYGCSGFSRSLHSTNQRGIIDDSRNDYYLPFTMPVVEPRVRIEKLNRSDVDALDHAPLDSIPKLIYFEKPHYPDLAAAARIEGILFIEVTIDSNGHVEDARYVAGSATESMKLAALKAARKFRYRPGLRGDQPVACKVVHGFYFELSSE